MRKINVFLIYSFFYPLFCYSAGTEIEIKQLQEINDRSFEKMEAARAEADGSIKNQIKNLPERKKAILDLKKSWESTIQKKCTVEIFESLHTDGEIAYRNNCLEREYQQEKIFFDNIYP
ncbi:hypothetical protein SC171_09920 [Pantoea cypripedii]|uniref:hypothetical protein n=1 Tax=Pantoea cypripedii TaxID=55209 RepID=UPI002FCA8AEF